MPTQIFVNLPVKDLKKTQEFFSSLGFLFNEEFTDDNAACMIIGENIFTMLLVESFFKGFVPNEICDAKKHTEVLVCVSLNSREQVDQMVQRAVAAGGNIFRDPQDHGFMYQHGFQDIDGHVWELIYMTE